MTAPTMTEEERAMHPGDLGLILLQCPVALGFEGHDCNGPDCNCGATILTPDAWLYVNRSTSSALREMREKAEALNAEVDRMWNDVHRFNPPAWESHAKAICKAQQDLSAAIEKATKP